MLRIIQPPNPATPSSQIKIPPFVVPSEGPIEVDVSVERDLTDETPVTVQLVLGSTVLASANLSTPAGPGSVNLSFDSSVLAELCEIEPIVKVIPCVECPDGGPIQTECCPEGVPSTSTLTILSTTDTTYPGIAGLPVSVSWNGSIFRGFGTASGQLYRVSIGCNDFQMAGVNSGWFVRVEPMIDENTGISGESWGEDYFYLINGFTCDPLYGYISSVYGSAALSFSTLEVEWTA